MIPNMPSLDVVLVQLQESTTNAGEDALEAMNTFIQRLLGVADPAQLKDFSLIIFFCLCSK
jgi:hypothetical protein